MPRHTHRDLLIRLFPPTHCCGALQTRHGPPLNCSSSANHCIPCDAALPCQSYSMLSSPLHLYHFRPFCMPGLASSISEHQSYVAGTRRATAGASQTECAHCEKCSLSQADLDTLTAARWSSKGVPQAILATTASSWIKSNQGAAAQPAPGLWGDSHQAQGSGTSRSRPRAVGRLTAVTAGPHG